MYYPFGNVDQHCGRSLCMRDTVEIIVEAVDHCLRPNLVIV